MNRSPFQAPSGTILDIGHTNLELSPRIEALILEEREIEAARLIDQARALRKLSAEEYVARGLDMSTLTSLELLGLMAKRGWTSIEYDSCKPGWRARWDSCEGYRPVQEVRDLLKDPAPKTNQNSFWAKALTKKSSTATRVSRKKEKT